jgi:hypothetical protein
MRRSTVIAGLLAVGLVLAGCSRGSADSTPNNQTMPAPNPQTEAYRQELWQQAKKSEGQDLDRSLKQLGSPTEQLLVLSKEGCQIRRAWTAVAGDDRVGTGYSAQYAAVAERYDKIQAKAKLPLFGTGLDAEIKRACPEVAFQGAAG